MSSYNSDTDHYQWSRSTETSQSVETELYEQFGLKFKVIGGNTYYANRNNEIIIKISDEKAPADKSSSQEPTIWNVQNRHKCCVCLKDRAIGNKVMQCGHPKGCERNYHKECGKAVGCVYYGSGMKLECPVHYQEWKENGIQFKYEPEKPGTDFDRVVAEVRSLISENDWDVEDRPIVGEINIGAINALLLIGKYRQQVSDREFLLLMRDMINEAVEIMASQGDD